MSALLDLAERVEQATGPDRDLDGEIATARGWASIQRGNRGALHGRSPARGTWKVVPAYTASLDAAMTLVPEGWHWQIGIFNLDGKGRAQLAEQVETEFGTAIGIRQQSTAATPALALCAAALRARAAEQSALNREGGK